MRRWDGEAVGAAHALGRREDGGGGRGADRAMSGAEIRPSVPLICGSRPRGGCRLRSSWPRWRTCMRPVALWSKTDQALTN